MPAQHSPTSPETPLVANLNSGAPAAVEVNSLTQPPAAIEWLLPRRPGAVVCSAAGQTRSLHFAPRRWLLIAPTEEDISSIGQAAVADCLVVVDVAGKWQSLNLGAVLAESILPRGIDLTAALCERSCAAVELFDCPVILVSKPREYEIWVPCSYRAALGYHLQCDPHHKIAPQ